MAKISLRVFKRGKPIFWIIGGVVVFVVFYMLFNKGGASSGSQGTTYVNSGPSEALQAASLQAGTATAIAQIGANVEAARIQTERETAALGASVALAQTAAGERAAIHSLNVQKDLALTNAETNLLINEANLSYGLETARIAAETQTGLRQMDVMLLAHQMDTNAMITTQQLATNERMFGKQLDANVAMFETQSENLIMQNMISQVSSLKKKDRDETLQILAGYANNGGVNYYNGPGPATVYN